MLDAVLTPYFVITAGHSGRMAVFADDGRLLGWTTHIREASCFLTAEAGHAAIRAICQFEYDQAVRRGDAVKVLDEETGEIVYMHAGARGGGPMRTPRIKLDRTGRSLAHAPDISGTGIRQFVRQAFAGARRQNTSRASAALLTPKNAAADEYTTPTSRRGKLARMAGAFAPA